MKAWSERIEFEDGGDTQLEGASLLAGIEVCSIVCSIQTMPFYFQQGHISILLFIPNIINDFTVFNLRPPLNVNVALFSILWKYFSTTFNGQNISHNYLVHVNTFHLSTASICV